MIKEFADKCGRSLKENGPINVVCIGDSVTQGCFRYGDGNTFADSYTTKFHNMLGFLFPEQCFNVINSGIGGTTAAFAATRLERDVLKFEPDLVIVMFGVNDCTEPESFKTALKTIFETLKKNNIPTVFITEHMMNTYVYPPNTIKEQLNIAEKTAEYQNEGKMDEICKISKETSAECGVPVLDIYSKWKRMNELGVDIPLLLSNGINHPIPKMHDMLAYELLAFLLFD